jgi:hypothetical protein
MTVIKNMGRHTGAPSSLVLALWINQGTELFSSEQLETRKLSVASANRHT